MMNWQATLTRAIEAAITDTLGFAAARHGQNTQEAPTMPTLAEVLGALDDAKIDADALMIPALKEACRGYGIEPVTSNDCPPIPMRDHDWSAYDDATMDVGYTGPFGKGRTEVEALANLLSGAR